MDEYINIGRWFSVLHRRSQIFVVEACEKLHLTYSEYVMLLRIYDHEGARQDELAAMLYLDKAVVTRTMTMLENKGLVYREQDARDKRAKHVYLTDYGKKQHAYLRNVIQRWVDYLVEDMEPAEVEVIVKGFDHLVDRACRADIRKLARDIPEVEMTRGNGHAESSGTGARARVRCRALGRRLRPEGGACRDGAARQDAAGRQRHGG